MGYIKTLPLPPPRCRSVPHQLPPASTVCIHAKVLWAVIEHYRIFMASRTLVREKLRAKYRERQENEVAKRTVVMCARLRRSLPLCEAGQLNIAALVGRWIDGH